MSTDNRSKERVLLYLLTPSEAPDASLGQRFVEGVQRAMQVRHRHILGWQGYGELDGRRFAVSEPLAAVALSNTLRYRPRPFSVHEAIGLVQQMAAALDSAAQQEVAHHGLTPDEIWLGDDGAVLISGFGLPRLTPAQGKAAADPNPKLATDQADLTAFSAPEQLSAEQPIDQRTDVYGLCAVCYAMLTGRPPFDPDDPALREQIIHQPPSAPDSWRPDLSPALVAVLKYGLAKDPSARYATAGEFAQRLMLVQGGELPAAPTALTHPPAQPQRVLQPMPRLPLRRGWLLVAPVMILFLLAGVFVAAKPFDLGFSLQQTIVAAADQAPAVVQPTQTSVATPTTPPASATPTPVQRATLPATPVADQVAPTVPQAAQQSDEAIPPTTATAPPPSPDLPNRGPAPGSFVHTEPVEPTIAVSTALTASLDSQVEPIADSPPLSASITAGQAPSVTVRIAETINLSATSAPTATLPDGIEMTTLPDAQTVMTATPPVDQAITASLSASAAVPDLQPNVYLPLVSQSVTIEGDVNQDANLRAGPGTNYPVVRGAFASDRVVLVACNEDCTWYQVSSGEWIAAFLVSNVADPLQTLPRAKAPSAPE